MVGGVADVLPRVLSSHVGQDKTVIDDLMSPGKRCTELRPGDRGFRESCERQTSTTTQTQLPSVFLFVHQTGIRRMKNSRHNNTVLVFNEDNIDIK